MLDQKVFLQGINYLKANYLNWQFDLNNDLMLKIWYKKFSNLETSEFMALVEKYTEESKYPPNSPADILVLVKSQFSAGQEAWEWLLSLNKQYPLDNEFQKPKFFQELKKDELAFNLFEQLDIEAILITPPSNEPIQVGLITYFGFGLGYRKDKFIKWYDNNRQPKNILRLESNVSYSNNKNIKLTGEI